MFFVFISILLNYLLTRKYGIIGTAFGSLIAIMLYNFIRFIYIKRIYGLQPFSWKNGGALISAIIFATVLYFSPLPFSPWFTALIKLTLFSVCYGFTIIKFNLSSDITELYEMIIKKLRSFLS
jgi:O-antigen/teichoic acid export membrane protein